ncbi:MAG TPA: DUF72 domain-containing protein [Caulobacteraceae bacterium]|jgi:uncharacterized protein YecE (DUF72 family)|nr:DUF72 domain-containing protein [Caulobacteraceae bacterium]
MAGEIRVGIGGWSFAPWRGTFFPKGVRQKDELAFASRALGAIEINSTYYSSQKPHIFAGWASETPEGFVFTLKASRFCTNRRILAGAGPSIEIFMNQGIGELGDRLGPILWQLADSKKFDPDDFAAFLDLFPQKLGERPLRHVIEARHESFADEGFVAMCRDRGVAICLTDHETFPMIDEATADFTYVRLMRGGDEHAACYPSADLDLWARRLKAASARGDVFAFLIRGGKPRAPDGAMALIERLG